MAADWLKIKSEYVSGNVSYRKLAEKYGVNKDTIALRAKKENWKELRDRQADKIHTRAIQKTEEKLSDALSDEAALKVQIRAGLFRLAADWVGKQEAVRDTTDFRRMVQSCVDLGVLDVQGGADIEDDGLLEALGSSAGGLFEDGDDSDMLPKEGDN